MRFSVELIDTLHEALEAHRFHDSEAEDSAIRALEGLAWAWSVESACANANNEKEG